MLEKFTVKNFLSFRDAVEVSFHPESIKEFPSNLINTPYFKHSLLKSLAIFGINSSGKSNLFKSIKFCQDLVLGKIGGVGTDQIDEVKPFVLDEDLKGKPSEFEFVFWQNESRYRFGFNVLKSGIIEEWLFVKESQKERNIYTRLNKEFNIGRGYKNEVERFAGKVRPNELFLTFAARLDLVFAENVVAWFRSIVTIFNNDYEKLAQDTADLLIDPFYKFELERIIKNSGFGIDSIKSVDLGQFKVIKTQHKVFKNKKLTGFVDLDLFKDESLGTLKYFALMGPILRVLHKGGLLIVDEFDSGFHTVLGLHLIKLFNDSKNFANRPQLIFSTHNHDLWDEKLLRRDQQIHLQKDDFGNSFLKRTYDYKIRSDKSIRRSYDKGELSNVPMIKEEQLKLYFGSEE